MNRSYNFQVDNGLFVAEYYLQKDYRDISVDNLRDSIELFAKQMKACNDLTVLNAQKKETKISVMSHNNSALTQGAFKDNREAKIAEQLEICLESIANHKTCMVCGERSVNVEAKINGAMMYGIPSLSNFINKGNNLKHVDVCGKCLFLSYLSFLNTQKISYPFLYNSDSDEFMRDITEQIQDNLASKVILDLRKADSSKYFIETILDIDQKRDAYGADYIDLIYFANGQSNYYEIESLDKRKLLFLAKLKHEQLINEFGSLGLFGLYASEKLRIGHLVISDKKDIYLLRSGKQLYKRLEEELMTEKEIKMIEHVAERLLEQASLETLLKELKLCSKPYEFESFIDRYSEEETLYRSNTEYLELTNVYKYKNFLIANLRLINQDKEKSEDEGK